MIENSGVFKMKRDLITYQDWNTEKVRFSGGKFTGATWGPDTATGDPTANAFFLYNSKGGYYEGGDAKMDDLTNKARAEFDDKKRQELVLRGAALQRRPLLEQQDWYRRQLRAALADHRRPAAEHLPRRHQLDGPPRLPRPDAASEEGVAGVIATRKEAPRETRASSFACLEPPATGFTDRPELIALARPKENGPRANPRAVLVVTLLCLRPRAKTTLRSSYSCAAAFQVPPQVISDRLSVPVCRARLL